MRTFTSPLKAWEGEFSLPDPDDFSGTHWKVWREAVNQPRRTPYADTHLYGYTGLELVKQFGEWKMTVPLAEVQSWENDPDNERTKLVAWIGREVRFYMNGIIDPKE